MEYTKCILSPKQTLWLILLPMLVIVLALRLYLHLVRIQHVYPFGYLVHHLYFGVLLVIPAAFVLAFGLRTRWIACLVLVALGTGSGLILDELVYLIATKAVDPDYISRVSLNGSITCVALAVMLLLLLYRAASK